MQQNLNRSTQLGGIFSFFLLMMIMAAMVWLGFYSFTLNQTIVQKFESRRWDIPARVYSRPLVLTDKNITKSDVTNWLSMSDYTKSTSGGAGTYQINDNDYTIHTRGFDYGDGNTDKAQSIKITFSNNTDTIGSLKSTVQSDILRLEPIAIGSIYPDSNEDRELVTLEHTPKMLIDALISTEDRSFYEHYGLSLRGLTRAAFNNFQGGGLQGGSTLTQQLVKNFYLSDERSFERKFNEAIMALLLERQYSKEAILETYINEINLGQNGNQSINGFGIAAKFYFNKPLNELRLDQHALLVAIAKGPSFYNPRKHPRRAFERRNLVLYNMLNEGKISQSDYDDAIEQQLDVIDKPSIARPKFPDFLDYTRQELNARYRPEDLKTKGLRIITTLDPIAQMAADQAFDDKLNRLRKTKKSLNELQGALVSANPHTGEVVAIVGSGSEFTGFNRATHAKRQVGSVLKPIIYLTALQSEQYNLASGVLDEPKTYDKWTPKNYSGISHGIVPLTQALANSYNQAAVNTGMSVGLDHFINYLKVLGIEDEIKPYPSALLGAIDLSPMQVLGVYQALASGGTYYPLHSIDRVISETGNILEQTQINPQERIPTNAAYLLNYAMRQVVENGTAKSAKSLGNNVAGKTGTTNDTRDAWFAGYSGNYVSVVWVGRDDNKPIGLTGGSGALPIWTDFMRRLKLTPVALRKPDDVEWLYLEAGTGSQTDEFCEGAMYLPATQKSINPDLSHCLADMIAEHEFEMEQEALLEEYGDEAASFEIDDEMEGVEYEW